MNTRCTLTKYIRKRMKETGLSIAQIARNSGGLVTASALSKLLNTHDPQPGGRTLLGIATGLGDDPIRVARAAMGLPVEDDPESAARAKANTILGLPPRFQRYLDLQVAFYQSLVECGQGLDNDK